MKQQAEEANAGLAWWHWLLLLVVGSSAASLLFLSDDPPQTQPPIVATQRSVPVTRISNSARSFDIEKVTLWWEGMPAALVNQALPDQIVPNAPTKNIHPDDYVGPESCRKCHKENYESWSKHSHRWMNALATEATVKGDFSGEATIEYLGGLGTFYREADDYRLQLERDGETYVYDINQTIGSRFFQYYVGRLKQATRSLGPIYYEQDHVLPFGYWLDEKEWVPVVHVYDEVADKDRIDPFVFPTEPQVGRDIYLYARSCNHCHTTFPLGDLLIKFPNVVGRFPPMPLHWSAYNYLSQAHAPLVPGERPPDSYQNEEMYGLLDSLVSVEATDHAVTLGISCEACHLGCREHAEGKRRKPDFTPFSPHLRRGSRGEAGHWERSQAANWACGRCHTGDRPQYANGISTWNSTDFEDAMRGSCYSQLTCMHCHNPHQAIGPRWKNTPDQDDAKCLKCHQEYEPNNARVAHTHHPIGTAGSRCMNCHMPRIVEGLQDVVRTHTIFSPTQKDMIHGNQLNACNLCHTDQGIDWTIDHLDQWYGAKFSEDEIVRNYHDREGPVGTGWLEHQNEAVRLVAADALTRTKSDWALAELINALDDPFLLNRQFAMIGIEKMIGKKLSEFGYRFYMTKQERREPLDRMKAALLPPQEPAAEAP